MRFLFVDRILELSPGEVVRGIKHISPDDHYLCKDVEGQVCFMPSLIGETLGQLAAWNVMAHNDFTFRPVAGVVSSAQLHRSAYVGETLELESFIDSLDEQAVLYHSIARVGKDVVFTVEGALGPLLPMADFIDEQQVRRQFNEVNRPGPWPLPQRPFEGTARNLALESNTVLSSLGYDHLFNSVPGRSLSAEKRITRAASYFADHFPNKPVLPMTILLESNLNLAGEFLASASYPQSYQVTELRKIKMNEFVHPGDLLTTHLKVKHQDEQQLVLAFRSEVEGKRVCVLELVMTARGNSI